MTRPGRAATSGVASHARYVPVGPCFLNAGLSARRAWRILYEHQVEFLGSEGKTVRRRIAWIDRLPDRWARWLRASAGTARFVRRRRRDAKALELPVAGDLAIVRRSGAVKVLDHDGGRVFTFMGQRAYEAKLRARLEEAQRVAPFPFAPPVVAADVDAGWFAEGFVRGRHPGLVSGCTHDFDRAYLPLLTAFVRAEPITWAPLGGYAASVASDVLAPGGLLERLPAAARERTATFVADLRDRLQRSPDAAEPVALAFSHGDFFSGNVVVPEEGPPRAIDWAHVGRRSVLHDLYYVLMNHCVKVLPPHARRDRIAGAVASLRERLAAEDPDRLEELAGVLAPTDASRWLFYLECIQVPLVRCDDPDDRYVRAMVQRLDWFESFERATTQAPS